MESQEFDKMYNVVPEDATVEMCIRDRADYVPDPYYGGAQGFENVLDILEDACAGLLTSLVPGN